MSWLTSNFIANMYGPRFLAFYLIFCSVVLYIVIKKTKQINRAYKVSSLLSGKNDPYEIACLAKGQIGLLSVIVVKLIEKGFLLQNPYHTEQLIQNPEDPNPNLNPAEKAVWQCFYIPANIKTAEHAVEPLYQSCITSLQKKGLVASKEQRNKIFLITSTGLLCSLALGMYKFLIALSRGYSNVAFLVIMMIILFVIYKVILWKDIIPSYNKNHYYRTPSGDTLLKSLGQSLASAKTKIRLGEVTHNEPSYLLAVALFGVTILPYATELSALGTLLPPPPSSSSSSHDDNDSGCSSSSCSSGCSSSSCSSGCGGCGSSD